MSPFILSWFVGLYFLKNIFTISEICIASSKHLNNRRLSQAHSWPHRHRRPAAGVTDSTWRTLPSGCWGLHLFKGLHASATTDRCLNGAHKIPALKIWAWRTCNLHPGWRRWDSVTAIASTDTWCSFYSSPQQTFPSWVWLQWQHSG